MAAFLLFLCIVEIFYKIQVSGKYVSYSKNVDRIVMMHVFEVVSVNNRNYEGDCCDGIYRKICGPCKFKAYVMRRDNKRTIKSFELFINEEKNNYFKNSKIHYTEFVNSNDEVKYDIEILSFDKNILLDKWSDFYSGSVMEYKIIWTFGIYSNFKLYGHVAMRPIYPHISYRSFYFFVSSIKISSKLKKNYLDCNSDISLRYESKCKIYISSSVENNLIWDSSFYLNVSGDNDLIPLNLGSGSIIYNLFKKKTTIIFSFGKENSKDASIDTIQIPLENIKPSNDYDLFDVISSNNLISMTASFRYYCSQYSGYNCEILCDVDTRKYYCDAITGKKYCKNGGDATKDCLFDENPCLLEPCLNKGICFNKGFEFFCNCAASYRGRFCEEKISNTKIFAGFRNISGNIICDTNFFGKLCEYTSCLSDTIKCNNGEKCYNYRGSDVCICANVTKGLECSKSSCELKCKLGKCATKSSLDKNFMIDENEINSEYICLCMLDGEKIDCEKLKGSITNFYEIYWIILFFVAIYFSLKQLIMIISINYFGKGEKDIFFKTRLFAPNIELKKKINCKYC